ncbi:MAG TPA: pitrilysin family protein [Patescibacteria group bacterium]
MIHLPLSKDPGIFTHTTLSNGISIYYKQAEQLFGLPKIACCALVTVGGRDDPRGKEGTAHFFEHMPFRGTKHFPTLAELTQDIENNGGYVNAFTSDEVTGYEVIAPTSMIEGAIARVADMFLYPILRPEDIEIERSVILEELRNKHAHVNFFVRSKVMEGLLGNHPLVYATIGTEQALNSIAQEDLVAFHEKYYNSHNLTLFFTGDFKSDELLSHCETFFGSITHKGEKTERNLELKPHSIVEPVQTYTPSEYNRSVYALGRVLPKADLRIATILKLYTDMLTRGFTSPLYQEIREKRGLAYSMGMHAGIYQDLTLLMFTISTQYRYMDQVDTIAWEQMRAILSNDERFQEVKHSIKQSILHREYSVGSLNDEAVDDFQDYGRIIPLTEYVALLDSIQLQDVQDFIEPLLVKEEFLNIRVNCDRQGLSESTTTTENVE